MFYRPVKTRQRPWTRHYYLLCNLRKTCFGVQLSGFPFCTTYLSDAIGQVQKRVLAIIYPNINYEVSLDLSRILKLSDWRLKACDKLFNDIVTTPSHNLGHLLPERHSLRYNLRQTRYNLRLARWIFGFRLTIVNSLSPFRNDLSRKFQIIYFFLNKYSLFHEESFFFLGSHKIWALKRGK